jgi:23S rRNA (guanosine2251-2'-O)-methyltransferase
LKRPESSDILYGVHPVLAAVSAGRRTVETLYISSGREDRQQHWQLFLAAESRNIPVQEIPARDLEQLTQAKVHQGVAARVSAYPFVSLEELLAGARRSGDPFLLVADGITDPHNLGALARTALCAGVQGMVIPKDNAASPTPASVKASAGALEFLPVARETNISRALETLKEAGLWIVGLDGAGEKTIYDSDLAGPIALVVGDEGRGIRRLVGRNCDFILSIPQTSMVGSLNASVAGAVAMYEVCRQRRVKGGAGR